MSTKKSNKSLVIIGIVSLVLVVVAIAIFIYVSSKQKATPSSITTAPSSTTTAPSSTTTAPTTSPTAAAKKCTLVQGISYVRPSNSGNEALFDARVPESIKSKPYSQWTQSAEVCRTKCEEDNGCKEWSWYGGGNACYRVNKVTGNSTPDGGFSGGVCN